MVGSKYYTNSITEIEVIVPGEVWAEEGAPAWRVLFTGWCVGTDRLKAANIRLFWQL